MPKLYGAWRSRATRNLWFAGEIGLDLTLVQVWQAYRLDEGYVDEIAMGLLLPLDRP